HGAGRETRTLEKDRRGTGSKADTGITGLALLAFLGAGCTPEHPRYGATVQAAIDYLVRVQWPSGDLAGPKQVGAGDDVRYARMYCHGMALFALAEAYAMSGDPRLIDPIHRGAMHTLKFQNPQSGGWRYQAPIAGEPG
ncbi:MAG: squalene--hopene cyclase, partial [Pirellulaceae bacterium]